MGNSKIETIVGLIIVSVAIGFMVVTYKVAEVKKFGNTYSLRAAFDQVEGIISGSDVMMSGIKVGFVSDLKLDTDSYRAIMKVAIDRGVKIPDDSSVQIVSNGLLGKKYVSFNAGASETMFADGDDVSFTQSSVNLETLIGKLIFSTKDQDGNKEKAN
jgi:phospholipid/cholesterol/gamma-HCH transport system substrate-binding protein